MSFTSDYHRGYLAGIAEGERAAIKQVHQEIEDMMHHMSYTDAAYGWDMAVRGALDRIERIQRDTHNETKADA